MASSRRVPIPDSLATHAIPCAPGHDVVYGLAPGAGTEIYLAPSNEFTPGLCAAVFAFDWATGQFRRVIDVAAATGFDPASGLMPHCKVHLCLNSASDGRVFALTHFTAPGVGQRDFEPIRAYRRDFPGCHLLEYDPAAGVVSHGRLLAGEGARISCLDRRRLQLYFLSYPRNHLWRYDVARRELHDLGRMGQENSFGLEVTDDGTVFTTDDLGEVFRYHPDEGEVRGTRRFLPISPGRTLQGNYARRMTLGRDGAIYGFTNKGSRLFRIDPAGGEVADLGVVCGDDPGPGGDPGLPPCKALVPVDARHLLIAFGGDGIYRADEPAMEFVRYDLVSREVTPLGRAVCPETGIPGWIAQCAVHVPAAGRVFWGMQQTVGQLRLWSTSDHVDGGVRELPLGENHARHLAVIARQPFGASVEGRNRLPFLERGWVGLRELGWRGEHQVIPAGETAVSALVFHDSGRLYGATCGRRAHLFVHHPYRQNRFTENYEVHPWDLGVVFPRPVRRTRLLDDPARQRLIIVGETEAGVVVAAFSVGTEQARYLGAFHSLPHRPPVVWDEPPFGGLFAATADEVRPESLSHVPEIDGFFALAPGGALRRRVGDGWETVPLAPEMGPLRSLIGSVGRRLLGISHTTDVLAIEFEPGGGTAVKLIGRAGWPERCAAISADGSWLALGGDGGRIAAFELSRGEEQPHVSLPSGWPIRALCWKPDGSLWGFAGREDEIGDAFTWWPGSAQTPQSGILQNSTAPRFWMCHRSEAMAAGARGEIYFGEHDRLAHLFWVVDSAPAAGRRLDLNAV